MAATFSLSDSLAVRQKLTVSQYREIQRLYKDLAKKAAKEAERLKTSTLSGRLQAAELKKLEKSLQKEADKIGSKLEGSIQNNMKRVAEGVVTDATAFNTKIGIGIKGAYRHVPEDIVETMVSGKLYKGRWSLSKSVWSDIARTQKDISTVVAEGIALNKSSYDIAKDLEMYVDPTAKKPWDWSKVYPGTKKQIDYNAQRLARTMVGHAYQQSVSAVCKNDPFVDGVKWISGHSSTTCEICNKRNGKIFPADKIPLDHPNGKCSFVPAISKSMSQIGDELADWANGKSNKKLDKWFKAMYPGDRVVPESKAILSKATSEKSKRYKEYSKDFQKATDTLMESMYGSVKSLPEKYLDAVSNYCGDSYAAMNSLLRGKYKAGGTSLTKAQVKANVEALQGLMKQSKLPEDLVSFRGLPGKFVNLLNVGDEFSDKAFLSSSVDKNKALGFMGMSDNGVLLRIEVDKGTQAIPATSLNKEYSGYGWLDEAEILFNSGQKFSVVSKNTVTVEQDVLSDFGRVLVKKGETYTEITIRTV